MKKLILVLFFAIFAFGASYAQKGQMGLGVQLDLASEII